MKKPSTQYTIQSVPAEVNEAIRDYAVREGCSLNQAAIEALRKGTGVAGEKRVYHDLDFMAGTWIRDANCESALEDFRQIDQDLWKCES